MPTSRTTGIAARSYIGSVIALGGTTVAFSLHDLFTNPIDPQWAVLAILTLLSGSITVRIPSVTATLSVSEAFVFASVLLFGASAGTVTAALDGAIISLWLHRRKQPAYRTLFNATAPALSLWVSAQLFFVVIGEQAENVAAVPLRYLLIPLAVFTVAYFLLNSALIAKAIALEQSVSAFRVWRNDFLWLSLNFFSGASVAALLVAYARQAELITALWIIVPLLVVSYLTYKTAMGRVEDANLHLTKLNRLYLSTIETLAMAIDAKDQITHGHIRRVQQQAVAVARQLGVTDENQVRAIEAAALLHDMGKLAVPDYILNKPGPLTPVEYEKIKMHASAGADILSSIEFPYPVVPIVRHHHENWDGSGYPDGLRGSEIPIGARILSVVDCYDALTSDRPYRPRLSHEAAMDVILRRRGVMYDPVVVNTFVRIQLESAVSTEPEDSDSGLPAVTDVVQPSEHAANTRAARLGEIAASSEETLTLFEISRELAGLIAIGDVVAVIARHLRRVVPSACCVLYVHDSVTGDLIVEQACDDPVGAFSGLRIPFGQRLTGWVAANRQTVVNSDPMLDLGELARALQPPLRSSISTPLVTGQALVGVLTLYSSSQNAFTDDHRRILEMLARQVSHAIGSARDRGEERRRRVRNTLAAVPKVERLDQVVAFMTDVHGRLDRPFAVVFVDIEWLNDLNQTPEPELPDAIVGSVFEAIRRTMRKADLLFHHPNNGFVVFLPQIDARDLQPIAERIQAAVLGAELARMARDTGTRISMGVACSPQDGVSFEHVVSQARLRAVSAPDNRGSHGRPPTSVH